MEFRLTYRGSLRANGNVDEKQRLRAWFHPQLRTLWQQRPLNLLTTEGNSVLDPPPGRDTSVLQRVGPSWFAPLITSQPRLIGSLDILMLRPEPPGAIILRGGDIDNRLKTLLDALRMPHTPDELPGGWVQQPDENPFFCLLEDDALITSIAVASDRLLEERPPAEVELVIRVVVKATEPTWANMALAI